MKPRKTGRRLLIEPLELRRVLSHPAAGDGNSDYAFDQRDLLQVLEYGKYNSGQTATWEEGDWNGDGHFDRLDLIAAMQTNQYMAAPDGHTAGNGDGCRQSTGDMGHESEHPPHAADPLLQLADQMEATHTAIKSGRWSDEGVWEGGRLPENGTRVSIPAGVSVTVDGVIEASMETILLAGSLEFPSNIDTELTVETLLGMPGSRFVMGRTTRPIDAGVTARLNLTSTEPMDRVWDPLALTRGFVSQGCVTIQGAQKTAFVGLAEVPDAGDRVLYLDRVPHGWRAGDQIAIPGVDPNVMDDEVHTISELDGAMVTLEGPLQHARDLPRDDMGLQLHAVNLSRNAIIQSPLNAELEDRGHVMFMHSLDVDIDYAGFYGLGRTNKDEPLDDAQIDDHGRLVPGSGSNPRGRYSLHFHRGGTSTDRPPASVHGSVVVDGPGWGMVNHSSFVQFTNNVALDVDGAAFVTEAGDEVGSMMGNIAIHSEGSGGVLTDRQREEDFGHEGHGFWLQGAGVHVTDNVAAGHSSNGFIFYTRGLYEPDLGRRASFPATNLRDREMAQGADRVPVGSVPIQSFRGNVSYGNWIGLETVYHLELQLHDERSRIEDFTAWNNVTAISLPYTRQTDFRDLTLLSAIQPPTGFGIRTTRLTGDMTYENVHIEGFGIGIRVPSVGMNAIRDGYLNNVQNILVGTATRPDRSLLVTGDIEVGTFPEESLDHRRQENISLQVHLWTNQKQLEPVFTDDRIFLDYEPYHMQQVYFPEQLPNSVPFPEDHFLVPEQYVGLSSQQLWDTFGLAVGGSLAPVDGPRVPGINGVLASIDVPDTI